jgi:uncharacterized phage protein gp47/JayE
MAALPSITIIPSGINTQIAAFPSTEDTALTLLQYLYSVTGTITDFNIGSVIRTLAEGIGAVDELEGIAIQALAFQALIYSAYNAFGISPRLATPSNGTVTFSTVGNIPLPNNINVIIPPNTIMQTNGGIQFTSPPNISIIMQAGTSSVDVPVQSIVTGAATNVPSGAITQLLTGLNYSLTVFNKLPATGGQNAETSAQTQTRFLNYVASLGLCSPVAVAASVLGQGINNEFVNYSVCYENWIQQILNNQTPFPGFTVYIDNGSGTASTILINYISQYLSTGGAAGFRPAGVPYSVVAVIPVLANVIVTATSINSNLITSIQTAITQAINGYFASLNFGVVAELTQLTAAVANVTFGDVSSLSISLLNVGNISVSSITPAPTSRVVLKTATISVT